MAGRFVRSSKYRHVFGRSTKKELCYDNLRISRNAWDSNIIKANPEYLSVNWEAGGGGAFAVIPLNETGKLPERMPLFRGHTAAVLDTDWSPFDDSVIASGSEDGKVFIWQVPENFTLMTGEEEEPVDVEPLIKLAGHARKVGHVLFHPTAQNVLATSSGDFTVKLWDVNTGQSNHTLTHGETIQSMSWSGNGSLLVTTCRDKKLRIWDPRQQAVAHEVAGHGGAKNSRAVWMTGDVGGDKIATTGFSAKADRQLGHWDLKNLSEGPVRGFQQLDSISGVCMPFWDESTKCLYLAGKGDGNIRYFEFENDDFIFLSEYKSADPQRGVAFLPKRGVNVTENEVMRGFKTVNDAYIEPISFIVPRRAETFQSDIYPDAAAGKAALNAEEWFEGKDAEPITMSLESLYDSEAANRPPQSAGNTHTPQQSVSGAGAFSSPTSTNSPRSSVSAASTAPVDSPREVVFRPRAPTMKAAAPPAVVKAATPTPAAAPAPAPAPVAAAPAKADPLIADQLAKITALLEAQNASLTNQSEQIKAQSAQISQQSEQIKVQSDIIKGQSEQIKSQSEQIVSQGEQIKTQSEQIKAQSERIESQTEQINVQSEQIKKQNAQIQELTKEVDTLKEKVEKVNVGNTDSAPTTVVVGNEELEEEGRKKDEIIRKLELELEEARS
ncbi:hypothetical protein FPQ18DRAFT_345929 [Pyronema domesticum]|nr:hypothetical protein FPQ18DRAFT_345929 [Pyronema domesticum]